MEEHERVLEALQTSNVPSSKVPLKFEALTKRWLFAKNISQNHTLMGIHISRIPSKHF